MAMERLETGPLLTIAGLLDYVIQCVRSEALPDSERDEQEERLGVLFRKRV